MKKRKGFTLTELIAVIVILTVIVLIAVPAYTAIRKRMLETQYENTVSLIETAAVKYAAKNGTNITNVEEIIEAGLIETDDGTNIFDPRDKSSMNCYLIEINYESGNYKTKLLEKEACDLSSVEGDYTKINIIATGLETGTTYEVGKWARENLKLSVEKKEEIADKSLTYKWQSDSGQTSTEEEMIVEAITMLNTKVLVEATTDNDTKYYARREVKIDKEAPIINDVELTGGSDWTKGRQITVTATDQKGSGIYGYYVGRSQCGDNTNYVEVAEGSSENKYTLNIDIRGLTEDTD